MALKIDELKQYLDSDANEYGLDSVATHGFLSASVVGRPLSDWQAVYFDGQQDAVAQDVKKALTEWREALLDDLQNEQEINLPFLADDGDTNNLNNDQNDEQDMDFSPESDLSAWCVGFVDAMYGNLDEQESDESSTEADWFADDELADDVAMLTLPMMVFSGVDVVTDGDGQIIEQDSGFAELRQDQESLAQMANSIEGNLTELYLLFHTEE